MMSNFIYGRCICFDHYKDELYIIASNLFSYRTKERLKESIERKIEDLKHTFFG